MCYSEKELEAAAAMIALLCPQSTETPTQQEAGNSNAQIPIDGSSVPEEVIYAPSASEEVIDAPSASVEVIIAPCAEEIPEEVIDVPAQEIPVEVDGSPDAQEIPEEIIDAPAQAIPGEDVGAPDAQEIPMQVVEAPEAQELPVVVIDAPARQQLVNCVECTPVVEQSTQTDDSDFSSLRDIRKFSIGLDGLENAVVSLYEQFQELIKYQGGQIDASDDEHYDDSDEWLEAAPQDDVAVAALQKRAKLARARALRSPEPAVFVAPEASPPRTRRASMLARPASREFAEPINPYEELVPIGKGYAKVPKRLMMLINWDSYTSATRQLLLAVFPRRVLATHCMTGKPSPAFLNKPAKKCLDPRLVEDIVMTVTQRCRVPEHLVRKCITSKCADEAKMFRNRQQSYRGRPSESDRENVPPTPPPTDSSFNK